MIKITKFVFHPILLSLYVPLFLFAHNLSQVYPYELIVPVLLFLLTGTVVLLMIQLITRNWQKSGVLSTTILFFLYFYGFIVTEENKKFITAFLFENYFWSVIVATTLLVLVVVYFSEKIFSIFSNHTVLKIFIEIFFNRSIALFVLGTLCTIVLMRSKVISQFIHTFHVFPVTVWFIIGIGTVFTLNKTVKNYTTMNKLLNTFTLLLLLMVLFQIAYGTITIHSNKLLIDDSTITVTSVNTSYLPDIYYFIPDEYAGQDTLLKMYNYSNDDFLNWLKKNNFYVIDNSVSNYNKTHLSVPSSLNLNFIEELVDINVSQITDTILEDLAKNNLVVKTLKKHNYTYINVGSRWSLTGKNPNADISYSYEGLSNFDEMVVESTLLRAYNSPAQLFAFDKIKEIPDIEKSPKFTFAHMPVPHVPFVYDKNGNVLSADKWYNFDYYFGQLLFVNKELKEIVTTILEKSKRPVVIIIQSDHGFRFCNQVSHSLSNCGNVNGYNNFNAYYFSDGNYSTLYQTITPVNSFRVIFNKYLKTNYTLLPDKSDFTSIQFDHD